MAHLLSRGIVKATLQTCQRELLRIAWKTHSTRYTWWLSRADWVMAVETMETCKDVSPNPSHLYSARLALSHCRARESSSLRMKMPKRCPQRRPFLKYNLRLLKPRPWLQWMEEDTSGGFRVIGLLGLSYVSAPPCNCILRAVTEFVAEASGEFAQ